MSNNLDISLLLKIDKEKVIYYGIMNKKIVLKMQYVFIENIAVSTSYHIYIPKNYALDFKSLMCFE